MPEVIFCDPYMVHTAVLCGILAGLALAGGLYLVTKR
jgi:hypothetical protein